VAVAVAAAGLRLNPAGKIETIAIFGSDPDPIAAQTAGDLAAKLGAEVIAGGGSAADLIVVPSQAGGPTGRIQLSSAARAWLNTARGSALVLAGGTPVLL
jgi:hypothetical protein